jgi:PAS domain S-box-containing protein
MKGVSPSERVARCLVSGCALTASAAALLALLVRLADTQWPWLARLRPGFNIALCNAVFLFLLGAALFAHNHWPGRRGSRLFGGVVAGVIGVIGGVALARVWWPMSTGPEVWLTELFPRPPGARTALISTHTAATYLCVAGALACLLAAPPVVCQRRRVALALALAAGGSGSFAVIGAVVGVPLRYNSTFSNMMALTGSIFMVLAAGLMLAAHPRNWLLQGLTGETGDAADERSVEYRRVLALLLVVLTAGIGVAGFHLMRREQANLRWRAEHELAAVADLKTAQVADWRRERLKEGNLILHTPYAARRALDALADPASESTRTMFTGWLGPFLATGPYAEALVLDSTLQVGLAHPPGAAAEVAEAEREAARKAIESREVVLTDLHRWPGRAEGISLSVLVPVIVRKAGQRESVPAAGLPPSAKDRVAAVIVLRMDARETLFPLVNAWPTPSRTAETYLLRRERGDCVFLTEPRHQPHSALRLRIPLDRTNAPAVQTLLGSRGPMRGTDYRNEPVLAAARPVPDSPWFLVAKVDEEEIYAPVRQRVWAVALVVAGMLAAVAVGLNLLWRRRDVEFLRRQVAGERERLALAKRLTHVMSHANDIIIMTDEQWRIVEVNDRAVEAYGYAREELRAMRAPDLRAPEARADFPSLEARFRQQGRAVTETLHQRKDGTVFPVEVSTRKVELDGAVHGLAIIRDVTERRRAEAAVRQSEERFRLLAESSLAGIYLFQDDRFVYVNPALASTFGYVPAEIIGQLGPQDLTHPEDRPQVAANIRRRVEEGVRQVRYEFRGLRKDGTVIRVEAIGARVEFHGRPAILGTLLDITERKQAEQRIREQAALLDAANDAIYVRALDHTITYWNDGAARLYGWTRAEALGRKFTELGGLDRGAFAAAHAALLQHGSWSGELKNTGAGGKEITTFCRWTLLQDEQGRPRDILAINSDITDKKQLEAQFLRAQRLEGVGAMAGGIAHDLNNILAPILMSTSLLRETVKDPETRNLLATTAACAQRGADIIKQLLTFARGKPSARVPMPVRHLLEETVRIVRETFPRNIQPVVDTPKDLWPVLGDPTQIHQALMNLCLNARDAMPDGGTLTMAAANVSLDEPAAARIPNARPGAYVCVSVTDTGTGIPPEILDRIFDPFFTTKTLGKGTGLGLPTVLGIARGHDGFVRVHSRPGLGTTIEIFLRASPQATVPKAAAVEDRPPRGNGQLILVVDDEASVRNVAQRTLECYGYRVETAAEGNEALTVFHRQRNDIQAVLTDMMMPGMEGPALVRALRQLEPELPIIGMTGLAERADVKGVERLRLPKLLIKPFGAVTLLAAVHEALARRSQAEPAGAVAGE